jgi:hypothetical protein
MTDTDQPATPTVGQAIANVVRQMPPIGKDQTSPQGYSYRGIEDILAAASKLLADEGVIFWARTRTLSVVPSPGMKEGWTDRHVRCRWYVQGPGGDQLKPRPVTEGVGRDNSDKGINKGHTQAKKYMLIDLLQIADSAADTDAVSIEHGRAQPGDQPADPAKLFELAVRREALAVAGVEVDPLEWSEAGLPMALAEITTKAVLDKAFLMVNAHGARARKDGVDLDAARAEVDVFEWDAAQWVAAGCPPLRSGGPSPSPEPQAGTEGPADQQAAPEGADGLPAITPLPEPFDVSADDWDKATKTAMQEMRDTGAPVDPAERTAIQEAVWKLHHATLDRRLTDANVEGYGGAPIDYRRALLATLYLGARRAELGGHNPALTPRDGEEAL